MAAAISGASLVKYNHSGLNLIITDLPLALAGTVPFFIQYPRAVVAYGTSGGAIQSEKADIWRESIMSLHG
jgi:hypothetical protein